MVERRAAPSAGPHPMARGRKPRSASTRRQSGSLSSIIRSQVVPVGSSSRRRRQPLHTRLPFPLPRARPAWSRRSEYSLCYPPRRALQVTGASPRRRSIRRRGAGCSSACTASSSARLPSASSSSPSGKSPVAANTPHLPRTQPLPAALSVLPRRPRVVLPASHRSCGCPPPPPPHTHKRLSALCVLPSHVPCLAPAAASSAGRRRIITPSLGA